FARNGAERVRDSGIDEDDSLLPHIVDGNTNWQAIDDVLYKALAFDYCFDCFSGPINQDAERRTGDSKAERSGLIWRVYEEQRKTSGQQTWTQSTGQASQSYR